MKKKLLQTMVLLGASAMMFSGCGAQTISINEYVDVEFEGLDSLGKATYSIDYEQMVDDNEEAFGLDRDSDEDDYYKVMSALAKEITGSLDTEEELSNGDKINFEWDSINEEKLKNKFNVKVKYSDYEIVVDGLEEAKEFNPFDYLTINYGGIAPDGYLSMDADNDIPVKGIRFTADNTDNLSNGDSIVVTIDGGENLEEVCLSYGMIPTATEKVYTVEGLPYYAYEAAQIPEETKAKMLKQAEDSIMASSSSWVEGNKILSIEHIGDYFLTAKEGFNANPTNIDYCVFKVKAHMVGSLESAGKDAPQNGGEEFYYTFAKYSDIMLMPDGTCTVDIADISLANNSVDTEYGKWSWGSFRPYTVRGYKDIDSMFNEVVTSRIDKYSYENTVVA